MNGNLEGVSQNARVASELKMLHYYGDFFETECRTPCDIDIESDSESDSESAFNSSSRDCTDASIATKTWPRGGLRAPQPDFHVSVDGILNERWVRNAIH